MKTKPVLACPKSASYLAITAYAACFDLARAEREDVSCDVTPGEVIRGPRSALQCKPVPWPAKVTRAASETLLVRLRRSWRRFRSQQSAEETERALPARPLGP